MANTNQAARGIQLVKTERDADGIRFFDRRNGQFIGGVKTSMLDQEALIRAAAHGITQNILDSSNKLEGDERIAFIKQACEDSQAGAWVSAPSNIDPAKAREAAIKAFMAMGLTRTAAEDAVAAAF